MVLSKGKAREGPRGAGPAFEIEIEPLLKIKDVREKVPDPLKNLDPPFE